MWWSVCWRVCVPADVSKRYDKLARILSPCTTELLQYTPYTHYLHCMFSALLHETILLSQHYTLCLTALHRTPHYKPLHTSPPTRPHHTTPLLSLPHHSPFLVRLPGFPDIAICSPRLISLTTYSFILYTLAASFSG